MNAIQIAPTGSATLNIPLGITEAEQMDSLQELKDAITDLTLCAINQDCMLKDSTGVQLQIIYSYADKAVREMRASRVKN